MIDYTRQALAILLLTDTYTPVSPSPWAISLSARVRDLPKSPILLLLVLSKQKSISKQRRGTNLCNDDDDDDDAITRRWCGHRQHVQHAFIYSYATEHE